LRVEVDFLCLRVVVLVVSGADAVAAESVVEEAADALSVVTESDDLRLRSDVLGDLVWVRWCDPVEPELAEPFEEEAAASVVAQDTPAGAATADPIPSATAKAPTRPIYLP